MSDLISNEGAMIALNNGEKVEFSVCGSEWDNALNVNIGVFLNPEKFSAFRFRLKPQTITINGIEVPAPFEPKDYKFGYYVLCNNDDGWSLCYDNNTISWQFGAWRTEDEIKRVVEALRSIFKPHKEYKNV